MPEYPRTIEKHGDANEGTRCRSRYACGTRLHSQRWLWIRANATRDERAGRRRIAGLVSEGIVPGSGRKHDRRCGRTCHDSSQNKCCGAVHTGQCVWTAANAALQQVSCLRQPAHTGTPVRAARRMGTNVGLHVHVSVQFAAGPGRCPVGGARFQR